MKMIETLMGSDAVQALGWTLIHAIWQVAGISLLLVLALAALRGQSPRTRYRAAMTALLAIVGLSLITYLVCYRYVSQQAAPVAGMTGLPSSALEIQAGSTGYFYNIVAFLYKSVPVILVIWASGVVMLSLRFAGNLWVLHRLRKSALPAVDHWARRLGQMATSRGIRRAVRLAESALISAPVLIGHLKPLILVPVGILSALPSDQVEAILAHELAHIRRNDFLVNLLQSVVEILYFFHPGTWWISQVLRKERELCCDDQATREGCDPVTLAFALSEVGEWAQAGKPGALALAFSGKRETPLLIRVKRLLGHKPASSWHLFPAGTLAAGLLIFFLLSGSDRAFSSTTAETAVNGSTGSVHDRPLRPAGGKEFSGATVEIRHGSIQEPRPSGSADTIPDSPSPRAPKSPRSHPAPPSLPSPPAIPEMPAMGPLPPVPPLPAVDSTAWTNFMENMGNYSAALADWTTNLVITGDTVKFPGFQLNFDKEQLKEFELSMKEFEEKMEKWGESYGKQWDAWAKANEPKLKEFELKMGEWEKEFQPKMEAYQRSMEKYQKDMQKYQRDLEKNLQKEKRRVERENRR